MRGPSVTGWCCQPFGATLHVYLTLSLDDLERTHDLLRSGAQCTAAHAHADAPPVPNLHHDEAAMPALVCARTHARPAALRCAAAPAE